MNPLISKLEIVATLSNDDRAKLTSFCEHQQAVDRGRDIVREAGNPENVYIMLNGWAARYKTLPDGSRQFTAFLMPGDLCNGEVTVLKKMDYNVIALTPVTVAVIGRDALIAATLERPKLVQAFWRATLVDEAVLRAWLINLGRRDAYARVAHLICELHARMSNLGLLQQIEFDLPLTQEHLGDALGLTAVHVNRVLKRLRDEGLMTLQNRMLTLLDASLLAKAASFDPGYLQAVAI
ncbi:Crp/Fnr family transcriptional regulator [Sphingomonas sp. LB3N6]|uniref:Crp/Fnr family transcriptional regulator n=1 Tax=Sphingomonas fucosidasi TaxID=3096164 RepID=UPI002FCA2375